MGESQRVSETVELFRAACRRENHWLSGDDRVNEATAARLLGFAEGSLKNLRWAGDGPPHYRSVGARISYKLQDLALWIEQRRCA